MQENFYCMAVKTNLGTLLLPTVHSSAFIISHKKRGKGLYVGRRNFAYGFEYRLFFKRLVYAILNENERYKIQEVDELMTFYEMNFRTTGLLIADECSSKRRSKYGG
jgi:hypothetical protein